MHLLQTKTALVNIISITKFHLIDLMIEKLINFIGLFVQK